MLTFLLSFFIAVLCTDALVLHARKPLDWFNRPAHHLVSYVEFSESDPSSLHALAKAEKSGRPVLAWHADVAKHDDRHRHLIETPTLMECDIQPYTAGPTSIFDRAGHHHALVVLGANATEAMMGLHDLADVCGNWPLTRFLYVFTGDTTKHIRRLVIASGAAGNGWYVLDHRLFVFTNQTLQCTSEHRRVPDLIAACASHL